MKASRIILFNLIALVILAALVLGGYYYLYQRWNYIATDDARVWADLVPVSPAAPGRLSGWKGTVGQTFNQGDTIGQIDGAGDAGRITAPISGSIIQSNATDGQIVSIGQPLATMADMKKLYILANIEETRIADVNVGADVDVTVDADPGATIKGRVDQVGLAANSVFSLFPQQNTTGNYTRVVQRIPVRISMTAYDQDIVPGMNATVRIHKS
ncbi:transporter [Kyrpidia spormannii]|uniref:Putative membrane fusion protein putative exporter subunit (Benzoate transcriptome) n=2 Tax=Kyrpidia spormannii TaxID=2055160 RepID=A0A2K8NCU0_9BACL|nr:efflux RND transporter periplasmic adaptor subunit [Kyrpidia spormannii]ATY86142.1 transporter [Kyrpidia spormannii]CAB3395410.1 putative membrane fusion protein; putative exporter subunit (benzoate transcriptome) [Kyrpidia spormannii]CAB3396133.1 putative membrane fusion protein; putative exporter subunit (benzoate transcriptome) [Kyrpidia spormannii]